MNGNNMPGTDTQIQIILGTLLDSLLDKSGLVSETINTSLRKIAKKHPNDVLKACYHFGKKKDPKPNSEHLSAVLNVMEDVSKEHIVHVDGDTVMLLLELCLELMTENVQYEPNVQMPASGVLVALGSKHSIQIVDGLITKLKPGVVPHYTIPHTLGSLANTNAYGVVPYLKTILGIMLPLLTNLKQDPLKQAFAYSLGKFCDAILEYTSNPEQAPDPTISVMDFQTEIGMAFDVLFATWLNGREVKLVEVVLYALAAMYNVLNEERIRQVANKSVQMLLAQYRKHKETQAITKCLYSLISRASQTDGTLLEPQLTLILQTLSDLICIAPDYAQPELLRTHSEVLRCYECLCNHYTDHTLDHVLAQMKNNNDKERMKGLIVLTHLANSVDGVLKNRLRDVLVTVDWMLGEGSVRVKRVLMKTVVAFAYKKLLDNKEIPVENYLQFIVKLCSKQHLYSPTDQHELIELKQTAENTLYMLTTSVKDLEQTLWILLLKSLLMYEHTDACVVLLRCLTHLASRKTKKEISEAIFVRCLALLALPLEDFRGTFVLNFLRNVRLVEGDLDGVWEGRLPYLLRYLEQNYDSSFNGKEWEDLVFDFLSVVLEAVKDGGFEEKLVECVKTQLPLYACRTTEPELSMRNAEKNFLLKCLAIISCHIKNPKLIQQILDIILQSVKLNDPNELLACARAIGICSRNNLRPVIDKLYTIRKDVLLKKNNKFFHFNFIKDQKTEMEMERVKYAIIASYADICNEAPADCLLRIIHSEILYFIMQELNDCKDFVIRRICLKGIGCVADALHPNRNKLHVQLQDRDKVLQLVSAQMQLHSGPEFIELFPVVIPVLTSLVKLPNMLETHQRLRLLKLCFDNVFNASAIYCKLSNDSHGDVKLSPIVFASFSKVNLLVQELLIQNISPATLDELFTLLEPWLSRKKLEQRLPALEALRMALQTYLDHMKFAYESPSTFGQTGIILARVVPRCTDPNKNTRKVAIECVCLILCISARYEGHMRDHDKTLSNSFTHIQEQIDTEEPKLLFNLVTDLANLISVNIPKYQLGHFIDTLIDGLLDYELSSSSGVGVVLATVVKLKGGDLGSYVVELMEKILDTLEKIKCTRTRASALGAVLNFATHHVKAVVGVVLQQPLPYNQSACSCWAILASDGALVIEILEYLKKILKSNPHYEEQSNAENMKIATLKSLQAVCAMNELFKSKETYELCKQQFPDLFSVLYISLACYIDTSAPVYSSAEKKASTVPNRNAYKLNPFKLCLDSFKLFLQNANSKQAAASLLLCNDSLSSFLNLVPDLTDNICSEYPQSLAWLVACLGPNIRSESEEQRVAVTALYASLLKHKVNNQSVLAENVLEMLLDVHTDKSCVVRRLSLRGLGYAAEYLNPELVLRHTRSILNALMQGLDYNNTSESEVALESMLSFSKLIKITECDQLDQCQITASVRIKPLLQHESASIREAAFLLFGDLAGSSGTDDALKEQINGNLVTLLLHLCDEDPNVVKACKYTMRKIGLFLDCSKVNTLIQEHLLEDGSLYFAQFCMDFVKSMSENKQESFPQLIMICLSFFKSTWTDIRANSALLSGLLYSQTHDEFRAAVSLDTFSYRLLQLLKDGEPEVRARASEALAYIFTT